MICCNTLEQFAQKDTTAKGLVRQPYLDLSKKVGDMGAVSTKIVYRAGRGQRQPIIEIAFCPFCGTKISA